MGKLAKRGWQRMDALVSAHGDVGVLHMICDQVANGGSLRDISQREGMPYNVLWKWLSFGTRMDEYRSALAARADLEAHRMLEIADAASIEEVPVAKLRTDVRKYLTSKWNRAMYGDEKTLGGTGVTVVLNRGVTAKVDGGVLEVGLIEDKGYQSDYKAEII